MQQELFDNILSMIPENLKTSTVCKEVIEELFTEISTDFTSSMKKSMGMQHIFFFVHFEIVWYYLNNFFHIFLKSFFSFVNYVEVVKVDN